MQKVVEPPDPSNVGESEAFPTNKVLTEHELRVWSCLLGCI